MLGFGKSLLMMCVCVYTLHRWSYFFTLSDSMLAFKDNSDCISKNYRCEGKHTCFLCRLCSQHSTFLGLILIFLRIEPNDYIEISWDPELWYQTFLLLLNEDVARSVAQVAKVRRLIFMLGIHRCYSCGYGCRCCCSLVSWCVHVIHQNIGSAHFCCVDWRTLIN